MIPRRLRALAVLASLAVALAACSVFPGATSAPTVAPSVADAPSTAGGAPDLSTCPKAEPPPLPAGEARMVTIKTDLGEILIHIQGDLSPIAAGNFVALAGCGFYNGVVFHRVVPNFVIQGGDPTGTGSGGPGYTIKDEPVTAIYGRGTVAMARTSAPDSVGSQFFIVLSDEAKSALASYNTYQIIGTVTAGMETADAIAAAADAELPTHPIAMDKVTVNTP